MKTVLIIDDEEMTRETYAKMIEKKEGYKVIAAGKGKEWIELCKQNKPDCVFVDMNYPTTDGIEILKGLKDICPEAEVYFITEEDSPSFLKQLEEMGVKKYYTKPLDVNNIQEILRII
jgi:DNA-binding NarL/FixJ family response regulator